MELVFTIMCISIMFMLVGMCIDSPECGALGIVGFIICSVIFITYYSTLSIIDTNKIKKREVIYNSKLDTIIITKKDTLFLLKKEL